MHVFHETLLYTITCGSQTIDISVCSPSKKGVVKFHQSWKDRRLGWPGRAVWAKNLELGELGIWPLRMSYRVPNCKYRRLRLVCLRRALRMLNRCFAKSIHQQEKASNLSRLWRMRRRQNFSHNNAELKEAHAMEEGHFNRNCADGKRWKLRSRRIAGSGVGGWAMHMKVRQCFCVSLAPSHRERTSEFSIPKGFYFQRITYKLCNKYWPKPATDPQNLLINLPIQQSSVLQLATTLQNEPHANRKTWSAGPVKARIVNSSVLLRLSKRKPFQVSVSTLISNFLLVALNISYSECRQYCERENFPYTVFFRSCSTAFETLKSFFSISCLWMLLHLPPSSQDGELMTLKFSSTWLYLNTYSNTAESMTVGGIGHNECFEKARTRHFDLKGWQSL